MAATGKHRLSRLLWGAGALGLGLVVSLFTAGPALFADGAFSERPPVLIASIAAFAVIGAVAGYIAPGVWKPVAIGLAISAVPAPLFFGLDAVGQPVMLGLAAGFMMGDAAAGVFGAWAGARLRGAK